MSSGSKVLVTGADGFIGSHLTEALVRQGAQCPRLRALQLLQFLGLAGSRTESAFETAWMSSPATFATLTA